MMRRRTSHHLSYPASLDIHRYATNDANGNHPRRSPSLPPPPNNFSRGLSKRFATSAIAAASDGSAAVVVVDEVPLPLHL